jgi:hypothetical protein
MMNQEDIFKKIGHILNELNDQYQYLAQNPAELNELELELFLANANFLSDHVQIIRKLNAAPSPKVLPEHTETVMEPAEDRPVVSLQQEEELPQVPAEPFLKPIAEQEIFKIDNDSSSFEFILNEKPTSDRFDFEQQSVDEIFDRPLSREEEEIIAQKQKLREKDSLAPEIPEEDEIGPEPFLVSSVPLSSTAYQIAEDHESDYKKEEVKLQVEEPEENPVLTTTSQAPHYTDNDDYYPETSVPQQATEVTLPATDYELTINQPAAEQETVNSYAVADETPAGIDASAKPETASADAASEPFPAQVYPTAEEKQPLIEEDYFKPVSTVKSPDLVTPSASAQGQPSAAPAKLTLNDILSGNTQLSGNKPDSNKPVISDLKQAISLNDKLRYIRDLFNGYNLAYAEAIDLLNKMPDFKTADAFLQKNYALKHNWADKQETADQFYELLNQRFPAK